MPTKTPKKLSTKKKTSKKLNSSKVFESLVQTYNIATAMHEALWVGDQDYKTIYVNPAFEKLTGYSYDECIGQDCAFWVDQEQEDQIDKHHGLRKSGVSSQYEANILSKSGKKIPVMVSGAPTENGGIIGIFTNLTQLKKLERQKKVAQLVLKHSREAVVILNKNRKVTLWNAGASKIFGYKEGEVLNKSIELLIPKDQRETNVNLLDAVDKKGYIKNVECRRLTKNGEVIDVSVSITKVVNDNKRFIGHLVIYRDITQQKVASSELQKRFEAIQDAYKELGLQKRHMDYFYEIIDHSTSSTSLNSMGKLIVSAMCLLTKCDGAALRFFEEKSKSLKLFSCFGLEQKWWTKSRVKLKNSIAEEAIEKMRPLIIDNISTHPKHQGTQLIKSHNFKTLILIPLFVEDKIIGTLSLYSSDPNKFRFIETDFLEKMGKQCSLALFVKMQQHPEETS
jgi:PAS domain S-box-containing protein